jgi:hypothetical protein
MDALTKLQAVNSLLQSINEDPVNSLLTSIAEVAKAQTEIDAAARSLQLSREWSFNTSVTTLNPNVDGIVLVPSGAAKLDATDRSIDTVIRKHPTAGMALWDRGNETWTFTKPVKVNITYTFEFDALPEVAKQYVVATASRRFQAKELGDQIADRFNAEEEQRAWAALLNDDAATADTNLFRSNDFIRSVAPRRR